MSYSYVVLYQLQRGAYYELIQKSTGFYLGRHFISGWCGWLGRSKVLAVRIFFSDSLLLMMLWMHGIRRVIYSDQGDLPLFIAILAPTRIDFAAWLVDLTRRRDCNLVSEFQQATARQPDLFWSVIETIGLGVSLESKMNQCAATAGLGFEFETPFVFLKVSLQKPWVVCPLHEYVFVANQKNGGPNYLLISLGVFDQELMIWGKTVARYDIERINRRFSGVSIWRWQPIKIKPKSIHWKNWPCASSWLNGI